MTIAVDWDIKPQTLCKIEEVSNFVNFQPLYIIKDCHEHFLLTFLIQKKGYSQTCLKQGVKG